MTVIKLDIDRARIGRAPYARLEFLTRVLGLHREAMLVYRTQKGWHLLLFVREQLPAIVVVAIQAIAGSDWRREVFTLQKARRLRGVSMYWRQRYNVLYNPRARARVGAADL